MFLTQVSYGADDLIFDRRMDVYSNLYRTIPSQEGTNRAIIGLMKKFDWHKMAIITSSTQKKHARVSSVSQMYIISKFLIIDSY